MAHIIPKLQENKEKTRNSLNLPRKLIKLLGWKKGDKIGFMPNLTYDKKIDKSQIILVNKRLDKIFDWAMNPGLTFIGKESQKWFNHRKNIGALSKDSQKNILSLEKSREFAGEKTPLIYPKIKIPKKELINHLEKRRRVWKMDVKKMSKQIKNLKRRKS